MHEKSFFKFEALGNDFIIFIDLAKNEEEMIKDQAPFFCHRRLGIGADGVIMLSQKDSMWEMKVINADGSMAKNCGNGLRCAALLAMNINNTDEALIKFDDFLYKTKKTDNLISIQMGDALVRKGEFKFSGPIKEKIINIFWVSLGNEHLVFLLKNKPENIVKLKDEIIKELGDVSRDFNLGFLWLSEENQIFSHVYERGVGFTESCATGAMAGVASMASLDPAFINKEIQVFQPGGRLYITTEATDSLEHFIVKQKGPATMVYQGLVSLN